MGLLFAAGIMNLYWIATMARLVSAEKLLPRGELIARLAGAGLVAFGTLSAAIAVF